MKIYSHRDTSAKSLLPQVSKYTGMADTMKLPYWIFTKDSNPIGIVTVGKEPIQLLAPVGTPVALITLIQKNQHPSVLKDFASQSLELALEQKAKHTTIELTSEQKDAIASFLEIKFKVLADTFTMTLQLDKDYNSPESIKIKLTQKEELRRWIELASRCLSGSADVVMERILKNIGHLPKSRLDMYYSSEKFYFVTQNKNEIGILNYNPNAGRISNVGVDPSRRGQGYGRQIMMFGLKQLKAAGCKQASLRVHVDNKPALNLYNSLGFEVAGRRRFLIWENETT